MRPRPHRGQGWRKGVSYFRKNREKPKSSKNLRVLLKAPSSLREQWAPRTVKYPKGKWTGMNWHHLLPAAIVVLLIALAGCAGQQATPPVTAQPTTVPLPVVTAQPVGQIAPFYGNWVVTTMGNAGGTLPVTPSAEISLTIDADGFQGYDGCNNYNAPYTLTGISTVYGYGISVGKIVSTQQYCRGLADQENAFLQTLQTTNAFAGDANHLTFTDINGDVLVFHRPGAVPTDTALPQYP